MLRRNRITKSLEMRARLNLNAKVLHERITLTRWIAEIRHTVTFNCTDCNLRVQESCAIAKITAQCALHMGTLKIFGTP